MSVDTGESRARIDGDFGKDTRVLSGRSRITSIVGASVEIVTNDGGVLTSRASGARVSSAGVSIIAV